MNLPTSYLGLFLLLLSLFGCAGSRGLLDDKMASLQERIEILERTNKLHIGQGVSSPLTHESDWNNYPSTGIYVDVNTSAAGFTKTPHYIVTLEGEKGFHWDASGIQSIYNATSTGFRVYIRWINSPREGSIGSTREPNPLRISTAIDKKWKIRWTGLEKKE